MPVIYDDSKKIFHLQSGNASYVMQVVKDKYLAHLYWGKDYLLIMGVGLSYGKTEGLPLIQMTKIEHFP